MDPCRADRFRRNSQAQCGLLRVLVHEHHIASLVDGIRHGFEHGQAAFVGRKVVGRAEAVEIPIEEAFAFRDKLLEGFAAGFLDEAIGIVRRGNQCHADGETRSEETIE